MARDILRSYHWDKSTDQITPVDTATAEGLMALRSMEEPDDRRVALEELNDVRVYSTFLMFDHNFFLRNDGRPILFETLPQRQSDGEWLEDWQRRFHTSGECLAYHNALSFTLIVTGGLTHQSDEE